MGRWADHPYALPPGISVAGIGVLMRQIRFAISKTLVPDAEFVMVMRNLRMDVRIEVGSLQAVGRLLG